MCAGVYVYICICNVYDQPAAVSYSQNGSKVHMEANLLNKGTAASLPEGLLELKWSYPCEFYRVTMKLADPHGL